LGFLTAFTVGECLRNLERIIVGDYKVSSRFMLRCVHFRGSERLHECNVLNDVVINKATLARIIQLKTKVNDMLITTYLADGLIVSSPTGSTAYSLAAGGPIIVPNMEAMILTPICPHTLTNRPIVLGSDQKVEIQLMSDDSEVLVTLDGQIGFPLHYHDRVVVTRASHELRLIENPDMTFFDVLSHKLKWGQR
jgi:NAD+ kinase